MVTAPTARPASTGVQTIKIPAGGERARVSFRQPVSTDGYVDAGWWPRSRSLTAELPGLLDVLWTAAREITRISYHLDFWDVAPRKIIVEGRLVRLSGYRYQDPLLVTASNSRHSDRIEFLIIPPGIDERFAVRALELASTIGQLRTPADLLALAQS